MKGPLPYTFYFISDAVITIDFGNVIDREINGRVISLFNYLTEHPLEGMIEAIPAYSSVSICFDIARIRKKISSWEKVYEWIEKRLRELMAIEPGEISHEPRHIRIPVCYENKYGIDLKWISEQKNIPAEEIIQLHFSKQYRVYMLGFLPGFAYMGEVEDAIAVPRKPEPQPILAGSVGIAGNQTGIYPLDSPGGWQIVGRTPVKMFDQDENKLCLLKAGDHVKFYSISADEFENYQSWGT